MDLQMAKRGRPLKDEASRKSEPVSIRLTPELRARLESDRLREIPPRTLSQEIDQRIRESFDLEKSIKKELGGADRYYWLLRLFAEDIRFIEDQTGQRFVEDRFTFDQVRAVINTFLDHFKPPGASLPPERLTCLLDQRAITLLGKRAALLTLTSLELAKMRTDDLLVLPDFVDPIAASRHLSRWMQKSAIAELERDWRRTQSAAKTATTKSRRKPK
jgi:hypothetical protein